MDQIGPLVLVIIVVVAFIAAVRAFSSVLSRGVGKVVDAGMRTVEKKTVAGLEEAIAVPLVLTSPASTAEIIASLDRIVDSKKARPGFGMALYESARSADRIEYSLGNRIYPQQLVVEVRLGERDGLRQVVLKCLHITEKDGIHVGAGTFMNLRESVRFAVGAAGDEAKVAEGARLFGPPEPGSPRAVRMRNRRYATWAAAALVIVPALMLNQAPEGMVPLYLGMLVLGGGIGFYVWRQEMNPATTTAHEAMRVGTGVPTDEAVATGEGPASGAAGAGNGMLGALRSAWNGISPQNKKMAGVVLLAVLAFAGITNSRMQDLSRLQQQVTAVGADGASAADNAYDQTAAQDSASTGDQSQDAATTDGTSASSDQSADGSTPALTAADVVSYGPADDSVVTAEAEFVSWNAIGDTLSLSVDDKYLSGTAPGTMRDVRISVSDPRYFYIDGKAVSSDEFRSFVANNEGALGTLEYTKNGINKVAVETPGDI